MRDIAFTTDLSDDEGPALATAVALAAASGAKLVSIHATAGAGSDGDDIAPAEQLAVRWGTPIAHRVMTHACCDDVVDTLLDALRRVEPALVVTGTHGKSSLWQLLSGSVAEGVARNVRMPTLVVPLAGRGLADRETGALDLRRIVVPAGDAESAKAGLEAAAWLASLARSRDVEVVLLHIDDGTPMPDAGESPQGVRVTRRVESGALEASISRVASEVSACAIVMATRGHDGLTDTLLGSHTERVLRHVECPVLAVPLPPAH